MVVEGAIAAVSPTPAASVDWGVRLRDAGFAEKADGSFVWDRDPLNLLLVPGSSRAAPTQFAVTVGKQASSSREQLDQGTPELVRLAIEALRGPRASVAFEYLGQLGSVEHAALRDATIRWAETASWSSISAEPRPQPLKGFDGWYILGARTFQGGTYVMIGVLWRQP